VEPSVSLPLLAGYVFGRKIPERTRLKYEWKGEILESMRAVTAREPGARVSRRPSM